MVGIKDLASTTMQNLLVEGHWCIPVAGSEKLAIEACKLQSTDGGVPRSTSWIMSWCRQGVIRQRRALMNPTSVTRNGANDFNGGENDLWHMIQGGGHEWMKDNVWQWMGPGWLFSERRLLNIWRHWCDGSVALPQVWMVWRDHGDVTGEWNNPTRLWYGGKVSCSRATCYH